MTSIMSGSIKSMTTTLDPEVCQKASRYAVRVCQEMSKRSNLINDIDNAVPSFERDEIVPFLGNILGKGGFNNVYELERIELQPISGLDKQQKEARSRVVNTKQRLAVKFLCEEAMASADEFCNGAADLLMEAKYLSALATHYHPGLIRLHGVAAAGASGFARGQRAGYFLIIDRLFDTLDKKIEVWRELKRRKMKHPSPMNAKLLKAHYFQRVLVSLDIALAIRHLHKLEIVFRDLKPDNVGFDYDGRVKLFDFGLAKELDPLQKTDNGMYKMSGGTGSRRFMAPEVALSECYNLSADIYSFAILFWEILALEKAFGGLSADEHKESVIKHGQRPRLEEQWSLQVIRLLNLCWNRDPLRRPSARDVCKALRAELSVIYDTFAEEGGAMKSQSGHY